MDPAFSLAEELAELHTHPHHPHYGNEDELEFHPHAYSGASLGDEFAQDAFGSLDAELEAMQLGHRGSDLASELDGSSTGLPGGSLAAELDPSYHTAGMGSLGDELLYQHNDPSAASSSTFASPHGVDSGTASPSRPAQQTAGMLSRSSDYGSGTASPSRWRNASGTSSTPDPTAAMSQLAVAQTAELQESWSSTQQFLSQLASVSVSSSSVNKSARLAADADGEDTARLESAAAGYLKLVSECTVEREAQLRELRELDRKLARTLAEAPPMPFGMAASTSWSSDLGGALSPSSSSRALPDVDEESDSFGRLPDSPTHFGRHHHQRTTSLGSDMTVTDTLALPVTPTALVDGSLFQPLYTSTSALAASLAAVHEHTQITKSSSADAARKLKTLRGVLTQWRAELDSAEQSETWIERTAPAESVGKGWASEQVEWCRRRFEEAEGRARELLTPVSIAG